MAFVDGFVAAVPTDRLDEYRDYASKFAAIFKEYGATRVVENWGVDVPDGKVTSFPMAVQRQENETVVFSWIEWPSQETRTKAWDQMMSDDRFHPDQNPMPFDGKRMIYGGFNSIVDE